jgi:thiol-disulfide isomerase/thioredoxin
MANKQQSAAQRRKKQQQQRSQRQQGAQNRLQSTPAASRRKPVERKRSWKQSYMVGIVLALIAVIVVAFVIISHIQSTPAPATPASAQVFKDVTQVDPNILAVVGTGKLTNSLKSVQGTPSPLTGPTGKPEFLYIGAEYCPFCAAERWSMVVALSRFGTFSQLYQTTSSSSDVYPGTPTFSFYSKLYKAPLYTSQYIDFVPVEETGNVQNSDGTYPILQTPTADQQQLLTTYDAPPYTDTAGSIPFVDIANKYIAVGLPSGYSPQDLANMQWSDIANSLDDSSSTVSQHVLGTANYLTAGICLATGQQPSSICSTDVIQSIEKTMTQTTQSAQGTQIALNAALEADLRKSIW